MFNVYIPAAEPESDVKEPRRFNGKGRTIVFVDDMETMLKLIPLQLENAGYKVLTAINGPEALSFFRSDRTIDLLITDYMMPLMTGRELIRNLRAAKINVPAIIVTGVDADIIGDIDAPILRKPYSQEELLALCENVLGS